MNYLLLWYIVPLINVMPDINNVNGIIKKGFVNISDFTGGMDEYLKKLIINMLIPPYHHNP